MSPASEWRPGDGGKIRSSTGPIQPTDGSSVRACIAVAGARMSSVSCGTYDSTRTPAI
jgi:hypothetical protein